MEHNAYVLVVRFNINITTQLIWISIRPYFHVRLLSSFDSNRQSHTIHTIRLTMQTLGGSGQLSRQISFCSSLHVGVTSAKIVCVFPRTCQKFNKIHANNLNPKHQSPPRFSVYNGDVRNTKLIVASVHLHLFCIHLI